MKRLSIVGVCIAVVVALSTMATGTAQAYSPELGQCINLASSKYLEFNGVAKKAKKGMYEDSSCTVYSHKLKKGFPVKQEKGNFEWRPGPPLSCEKLAKPKGKYADPACTTPDEKNGKGIGGYEKVEEYDEGPALTVEGGVATLEIPSERTVVRCEHSKATGEATGAATGKWNWTFFECEVEGPKAQCNSSSPPESAPTVAWKTVDTETVERSGLDGLKFTPDGGTYLAEYECPSYFSAKAKMKNYLTARYLSESFNTMGHELKLEAINGGPPIEQDLVQEVSVNGGGFLSVPSTMTFSVVINYASEVELRAQEPQL
ncbi:MAG TPA: hypothetical protein VLZ06_00855 [Solirubrobacteraceae bacterium]|nr:hypothetical protein [Solirubrobacteraceae bacterium]